MHDRGRGSESILILLFLLYGDQSRYAALSGYTSPSNQPLHRKQTFGAWWAEIIPKWAVTRAARNSGHPTGERGAPASVRYLGAQGVIQCAGDITHIFWGVIKCVLIT